MELHPDDVALMAGVSPEYYRRVEGGAPVDPAVLRAVGTVLGLSHAEISALERAEQKSGPPRPQRLHPAWTALTSAEHSMVLVIDASLRIVSASSLVQPSLEWLMSGTLEAPMPNWARFVFNEPRARAVLPRWREEAALVAAILRASAIRHMSAEVVDVVGELVASNDEFVRIWETTQPVTPGTRWPPLRLCGPEPEPIVVDRQPVEVVDAPGHMAVLLTGGAPHRRLRGG